MSHIKSFGERIADALLEDGLLSPEQFNELKDEQKKSGTRLIKLLESKDQIREEDMIVSMGRVLNVPPINLARVAIPKETAEIIPREMAVTHKILPITRIAGRIYLAMADPLNVLALDDVRQHTSLDIKPMISSERAIKEKLHNLESSGGGMEDFIQDAQELSEDSDAENLEFSKEDSEEVNLDQLAASSEEAPVVKLANLILVQAIKDRASDIHIEPFEKTVRLRYRIDGELIDVTPPPKAMQMALASRIKIMSNLDIAERRLPQDGRMRVKVGGRDIDSSRFIHAHRSW